MKMKVTAVLLGLGAAGLGIAWATGQFGEDPQLKEVKQLQQKLQDSVATEDDTPSEASREERRELIQQLHEKAEALPEEERSAIRDSMMTFFMSRMEKRVDEFFELPPDQRQAALDEHIDRMEERRKSWEARRRQAESEQQAAAGQAPRNGPDPSVGGSPSSAQGGGGTATPAGGGPGGGQPQAAEQKGKGRGPGPGPRGFRNMSDEQREQWRRRMLERTTPEARAKFTEFRRLVEERRQERGLPAGRF
jgi:hypothetical protein